MEAYQHGVNSITSAQTQARMVGLWLLYLLGTLPLSGQDNSPYVDRVLSLVTNNSLTVYNEDYQPLSPLHLEIIRRDTVVCDLWTRPKYVDNVYNTAFDGVIIYTKTVYDTLTHPDNRNYLQFVTTNYDENGRYLGKSVAFLIKKQAKLQKPHTFDQRLITGKYEYWVNTKIMVEGKSITLDSCHQSYRIRFLGDHQFQQAYANGQTRCYTAAMRNEVELGIETSSAERIQEFVDFHNCLQGHYLTKERGRWYLRDNQLILWQGERTPLVYDILEFSTNTLQLKLTNKDYVLRMTKKAIHP